jgi:hypothetical protein
MVNDAVATVRTLSRAVASALGDTANVTVPGPVPLVGDCAVTHPVAPATDQAQVAPVDTVNAPAPPSAGNDWGWEDRL